MRNWIFNTPGRLNTVIVGVVAAFLVGLAVFTSFKTNAALDRLESAKPTATPTIGGDERYGATPDPVAPTRPLQSRDEEFATAAPDVTAFPDAGSPAPVVISAVDAWRRLDFDALPQYMLPSVLEDAVANPPAPGMKVTGVVRESEPGPTQSVVDVPTNKGLLKVDAVVVDGKWMIASMGWE